MIKKLLQLSLALLISGSLFADEGMWLPSEIIHRIKDMQSKGCKLSAKDIYNINSSSLKDAIVHFGGGCTGELISKQGLLITNHHCGFKQIQSHSSLEHDYLKYGFWAYTQAQELPNTDLTVSFLEYMKDVTDIVLNGVTKNMTEQQRHKLVETNSKQIEKQAVLNGKGLKARVTSLYYGNQYFLFVYKVFTDVRLVGAPPSSIGKFGGNTDNWMWPRHTGDFSIFRIYADKNNEPAAYSKDNVPYMPKKFLRINASGIKEGDFTMVYGFPSRTNEYLVSDAIKQVAFISNPHKIKLRTLILDIQNREMAKDQGVRIKYASKNATVANAWKKWQGEMKGIIRLNTVAQKEDFELNFEKWAKGKPEYEGLLNKIHNLYASISELSLVSDYQNEALNAVEIIKFAGGNRANTDEFNKNYYQAIDKYVFIALYNEYKKSIATKYQSPFFKEQLKRFNSVEAWADDLFSTFSANSTPDILALSKAKEIYTQTNTFFNEKIAPTLDSVNSQITLLYRTYMNGQMEYNKENNGKREFYPDANSTLRITYGKVNGYNPSDAVYYKPMATLEGIMQKDNPNIYDYNIPQKLRDLYKSKDYGRWAVNGTVPVAFIATNHTSGGNSGSPVLDKNGYLIGVNFDRVWEGTMSDIVYDPLFCRNIALDIRYALFIIDKLAGADRLIKEMDIR